MHPLNQKFDRIVCLSLVEREDKYNHVKMQFDALGIDVDFHRSVIHPFNREIGKVVTDSGLGLFSYDLSNNEYACTREHYAIVKQAYLEGVENLFVFEDDISLRRDFNEQIVLHFNSLAAQWDLLMFNAISGRSDFAPVNEFWVRPSRCWGAGAYGLNRRGMEYFITTFDVSLGPSDLSFYRMPTLDQFNCYLPIRPLVIQSRALTSSLRGQSDVPRSRYERGVRLKDFF